MSDKEILQLLWDEHDERTFRISRSLRLSRKESQQAIEILRKWKNKTASPLPGVRLKSVADGIFKFIAIKSDSDEADKGKPFGKENEGLTGA